MSQQLEINTYQSHRPYKTHIPSQTYTNQQYPSQTCLNFNQSVIELIRHQIN